MSHTIIALALVALLLAATAKAVTAPDQLAALINFRDANINKSTSWSRTLSGWTCPTDPADSDQPCDPCSKDWSGNWEFIHCRGSAGPYGEGSIGDFDGRGELCGLQHLRELDLDGSNFNGPFPDWVLTCFPGLQELDLSFNRLTGTLPSDIARLSPLQELKLMGTIPAQLGGMPRLRVLRLERNHFTGTLPKELNKLAGSLNGLELAHNNLEGDLMGLASVRPMYVTISDNPRLCGMVPAGIRFAHGYNPYNTRLGQPC
ncbi:hypothetical protein GPECTOR_31g358 [Gonium pectorale]|uniref:Leucine-rich repeat-containing N-terminal plant-type domain-containing protein n=1 Tax=Gonium pectorale TaxID=33097 RepID=A0A150GEJ9_GONPE|nr:hypothetical protein GPECTOR_31g358 [Gonium pectorale]|eukprot:KXZ47995.1 hypothetical protein GPECTOR_31g358 [Gonium pectorale]